MAGPSLFSPRDRLAASLTQLLGPGADPAAFTPRQVLDVLVAIGPTGLVVDHGAVHAYIAATLRASEPAEGWTAEQVATVMESLSADEHVEAFAAVYGYAEAFTAVYGPAAEATNTKGE